MVTATAADRTRDAITRLGASGLGVAAYAQAVGEALTRVVPAEGTCLMTVDPATLLPTAEYVENGLPAPALLRMVDIELREPDVNKWTDLAQADRPAASLSDATRGDLDVSLRQREIRRPGGFADELRVVLANGTGTWGQLTVFRTDDRPWFSSAETAFVATVAPLVAEGLRHAMVLETVRAGASEIGLLVLDADDQVTMANPSAHRFLDALGRSDRPESALPLVVSSVARQARAAAVPGTTSPPRPVRPSVARARARSGEWLLVRGSVMGQTPESPVTVVVESVRQAEMVSLMVQAYGFTEAERRVTELVAQGLATRQIAQRLRVSEYTVQDHLKAIFRKSDTGSRGDLVARLFIDHHADRLTGGPATSAP